MPACKILRISTRHLDTHPVIYKGMRIKVMTADGKQAVCIGTVVAVRRTEVKVYSQGRACWHPVSRIVPLFKH